MDNIFLKFLAYCLDESKPVLPEFEYLDWHWLYTFGQQQAIPAILLSGINRYSKTLNKKLSIPQDLLYEWFGQTVVIENQNKLVNQRIKELIAHLTDNGFKTCILKGQGNAAMYPHPILRSSGDIDVWLDATKDEIAHFVHKSYPEIVIADHHMDYPIFKDVEVEVHYYPSFSYNYRHNKRLQAFFNDNRDKQFQHVTKAGYATPTTLFNLVFQLSHMMRHFFTQGIGLRHAIDYYYLLQQYITEDEKAALIKTLKECGMYKFFRAIMWIETNVLGLEKNTDIVAPQERAGKMVLHEMLKGGNFGHQYSRKMGGNVLLTYAHQLIYNMKYFIEFPVEPVSRPVYLVTEYVKRHYLSSK